MNEYDIAIDAISLRQWQQLLSYIITCIGFISAMIALNYQYDNRRDTLSFAIIVAFTIWILLGFYPIGWGTYGDRENYAYQFLRFHDNSSIDYEDNDIGFQWLNYILSRYLDVTQYFIAIAGIYLFNYFFAIRKFCKQNVYWMLVAVILSMGFISYNTNTMRAGLAISFIVLGLSQFPSKLRMAICFLISYSIHGSMIIPILLIFVSYYFNKTSLFLKLWILAVPISFISGDFFNTLFQGFVDDSRSEYLTESNSAYNIGFRIDFVLYSLAPIAVGGYYIFKKNIQSRFYSLIYNSYILTNIFWVLVIRANFSDRFAYLSWWMIPFILTYPLLTKNLNLNEGMWLCSILLSETIFLMII